MSDSFERFISELVAANYVADTPHVSNCIKYLTYGLYQQCFNYDARPDMTVDEAVQYLKEELPEATVNIINKTQTALQLSSDFKVTLSIKDPSPMFALYYRNSLLGGGILTQQALEFIVYLIQHEEYFARFERLTYIAKLRADNKNDVPLWKAILTKEIEV